MGISIAAAQAPSVPGDIAGAPIRDAGAALPAIGAIVFGTEGSRTVCWHRSTVRAAIC